MPANAVALESEGKRQRAARPADSEGSKRVYDACSSDYFARTGIVRVILTLFLLCCGASAAAPLPLEPVYRLKISGEKQRFMTSEDYEFKKRRGEVEGVAFMAVCTNTWAAGLVPIFAVEKTNRVELRRRPALGQENSSEPLFYGLPPVDEPEAAKIAGRWECIGIRGTGSKEFFGWDLAVEGENVAGRFDQFTDFRFGRIVGGTFRSNVFELRVEYIMDAYAVTGKWHAGKLTGVWTRVDESENGTWEATRPAAVLPEATNVIALYEWKRADNARRYLLEGETPGAQWARERRPICRVWKAQ